MMKKVSMVLGVLLLATVAHAEPLVSGPYLTLRGGADSMRFKVDDKKDNKTTIAFLTALGLRVKAFRAEFEWANISRARLENAWYQQQRYMAQFYYEIPFRSKFRPYLNAGAGVSYIDAGYHKRNTRKSGDDTTFAWNIGGGLTFNWTRAWSFDLGYRFIDAGKIRPYEDAEIKVQNHEGYFGVRYTF